MSHEPESKKRDREDAAPAGVPSPLENFRKRFVEIDTHIARFQKAYEENSAKILENNRKAQMRAAELKAGMFTPAVESPAELYINAVEMLFEQSLIVYKAYELNSDINAYLKTASADESTHLAQYKNALEAFIIFIGQEVNVFINIYVETKDAFLKAGVKRALSENPPLQVWLHTFVNVEGKDPLVVSVTNEVKRLRHETIEVFKGAFDAQVSQAFEKLCPAIDAILDRAVNFDEQCELIEFKKYLDEVAFYAEHCFKTLKDALDMILQLKILINISDKIIREIRAIDEAADVSFLMDTFAKVREWTSSLESAVNSIYRPMRALVTEYTQHGKTLPDKLKAFMKPWLDEEHPSPLKTSIYAYENPNYFPETRPVSSKTKTTESLGRNLRF